MAACGGGEPAATAGAETTPKAASGEGTVVESPARKPPPAAAVPCPPQLGELLNQLEHLRRSLVIGVSYEQYLAELETVRKSYRRVPVGELGLACVSGPAASAERSFDGYLAAANTWGECVSDPDCETAALEPKLQRKWRAAAKQLKAAQRALATGS